MLDKQRERHGQGRKDDAYSQCLGGLFSLGNCGRWPYPDKVKACGTSGRGEGWGIASKNGLEHPQNSLDPVDIVTHAINDNDVVLKFQKLPVLPRGHTTENRFEAIAFLLIEQPRPDHLRSALSQASVDVVLLGFNDDDNGCLEYG